MDERGKRKKERKKKRGIYVLAHPRVIRRKGRERGEKEGEERERNGYVG